MLMLWPNTIVNWMDNTIAQFWAVYQSTTILELASLEPQGEAEVALQWKRLLIAEKDDFTD